MLTLTLAFAVVAVVSTVYAVTAWRRTTGATPPIESTSEQAGWEVLEQELRRARRHGRPLTLNRVTFESISPNKAAEGLAAGLRATDVCFATAAHVYVALPETTMPEARCALRRLCRPLENRGIPCRTESVTYPNDALTAEALLARFRPIRLDAIPMDSVES